MRNSLSISGALLALAAFISTADARMMGGGTNMPGGMQHGASLSSSMPSSLESSRSSNDIRHSPYYYHPLKDGYFGGSENRTMPPLACRGRPGGC